METQVAPQHDELILMLTSTSRNKNSYHLPERKPGFSGSEEWPSSMFRLAELVTVNRTAAGRNYSGAYSFGTSRSKQVQ